ncbi:uncharacterized protein LOC129595025 [Paramacrobiotus metropolitanus]|uniref:uncharacterized protein LOC129595025 n=1 Tax=Paramacrobiotus metropolitanus TaxID=2943436 RepID=UPI002445D3F5|nr:uncharacterized protein LOC129595025 [Paramacrobiotus metropolitanus]
MDATIRITDVEKRTNPKKTILSWVRNTSGRLCAVFQEWNCVILLSFVAFLLATLSVLRFYVLIPFFKKYYMSSPGWNGELPHSAVDWCVLVLLFAIPGIIALLTYTAWPLGSSIAMIKCAVQTQRWLRAASSGHDLSPSDMGHVTKCYHATSKFFGRFRATMVVVYTMFPAVHLFFVGYLNTIFYYDDGSESARKCDITPSLHYLIPAIWIEPLHVLLTNCGLYLSYTWQKGILHSWYIQWTAANNTTPDIQGPLSGFKAYEAKLKLLEYNG